MAPPKDVTAVTSGVSPPAPRREKAVLATDEEARKASAWVMANYKDAFMELARYDTN